MKDKIQQNNTIELSKEEKKKAWYEAYKERNKDKIVAYRSAYCKDYYKANKGHYNKRTKAYYEANKEKVLAQCKQYRLDHIDKRTAYVKANKEKLTIQAKVWRDENRDYHKKRCAEDPLYKFVQALRGHSSRAFKRIGQSKPIKTLHLLGCSWEEAKERFESLFQPGMTWSNHGEWHIDHIVPLASATTIDEAKALNHISNLQPLWAVDNLIKGAKENR